VLIRKYLFPDERDQHFAFSFQENSHDNSIFN
jgi:hypothetical protein